MSDRIRTIDRFTSIGEVDLGGRRKWLRKAVPRNASWPGETGVNPVAALDYVGYTPGSINRGHAAESPRGLSSVRVTCESGIVKSGAAIARILAIVVIVPRDATFTDCDHGIVELCQNACGPSASQPVLRHKATLRVGKVFGPQTRPNGQPRTSIQIMFSYFLLLSPLDTRVCNERSDHSRVLGPAHVPPEIKANHFEEGRGAPRR